MHFMIMYKSGDYIYKVGCLIPPSQSMANSYFKKKSEPFFFWFASTSCFDLDRVDDLVSR